MKQGFEGMQPRCMADAARRGFGVDQRDFEAQRGRVERRGVTAGPPRSPQVEFFVFQA
jgi:hypothetical protein